MDAEQIVNFKQRVANYTQDNLSYIREYNEAPIPQDILDYWDTNGPEGVGEELAAVERVLFLETAEKILNGATQYEL